MTGPFPSAGAAAIAVLWSPCSWRSRALLRSPADYYAASMLLVVARANDAPADRV